MEKYLNYLHFDEDKETILKRMDEVSYKTVREGDKVLFPFDGNYLTIEPFKDDTDDTFVVRPFSGVERERYKFACAFIAHVLEAKISSTNFWGKRVTSEYIVDVDKVIIGNLDIAVDSITQFQFKEN